MYVRMVGSNDDSVHLCIKEVDDLRYEPLLGAWIGARATLRAGFVVLTGVRLRVCDGHPGCPCRSGQCGRNHAPRSARLVVWRGHSSDGHPAFGSTQAPPARPYSAAGCSPQGTRPTPRGSASVAVPSSSSALREHVSPTCPTVRRALRQRTWMASRQQSLDVGEVSDIRASLVDWWAEQSMVGCWAEQSTHVALGFERRTDW